MTSLSMPCKIMIVIGSLLMVSATAYSGSSPQTEKIVKEPSGGSPTRLQSPFPKRLEKVYAIEIQSIDMTRQCQLRFRLKNTGTSLTAEQYRGSYIRVGQTRALSLSTFDPGGRLKTSGQALTRIENAPITDDTNVSIEVKLFDGSVTSKQEFLQPACFDPKKVMPHTTGAPRDAKVGKSPSSTASSVTAKEALENPAASAETLVLSTKVVAQDMLGAIGDTVPLKATLSTRLNGKPLVNHSLQFYVSGSLVGSGRTDKRGQARVNFKVPDEIGSKEILVQFTGSDDYPSSTDTANFSSFKSSSKIKLRMLNEHRQKKSGHYLGITGHLARVTDNAGITGREITIEAQGKVIEKVASGNGYFSAGYQIPDDFVGNLKLSARYEGDDLYLGTFEELSINILPRTEYVYLFWDSLGGQVGQTVDINVRTSMTEDYSANNGVAGVHIGISRDGIRISDGYTDANGQFNDQIRLEYKAGEYDLNVYRISDQDSSDFAVVPRKRGQKLTITKSPVAVWINGSTTARIGDKLMFTVTVHRTSDDSGVGDVPVQFSGGGIKNTSYLGSAAFAYTVPSRLGNQEIFASTKGTDRYEAGKASFTLNVLPKNN